MKRVRPECVVNVLHSASEGPGDVSPRSVNEGRTVRRLPACMQLSLAQQYVHARAAFRLAHARRVSYNDDVCQDMLAVTNASFV
jgi:hypothetical protein